MSADLKSWATAALAPLLPLDPDSLSEVVTYAATLSSPSEVADHFTGLLDTSPASISFITDFNSRRFPRPSSSPSSLQSAPPRHNPKKKSKSPLNRYAHSPRQANEGSAVIHNSAGAYLKPATAEDNFYGPRSAGPSRKSSPRPASPAPQARPASHGPGILSSDLVNVKKKTPKQSQQQQQPSNASQKVVVTGGTPMRGASSVLSDLEAALKALEMSTNPTIASGTPCGCQGSKHPVLVAAPNCLHCGRIVCVREGLGPCRFCGEPLLRSEEVQGMIRSLRLEKGREKMVADNYAARRNTGKAMFEDEEESFKRAQEHRDRLLGYQATSAERTRIIDQQSDFDTGDGGTSMWATPEERARQLRQQQRAMQQAEWNSKQDYEKRRVVVSIDLQGRRVVKEMQEIEPPPQTGADGDGADELEPSYRENDSKGAFSNNPLAKGLVRPVWRGQENDGKDEEIVDWDELEVKEKARRVVRSGWKRVQDNFENEETQTFSQSGIQRGAGGEQEKGDEPACG